MTLLITTHEPASMTGNGSSWHMIYNKIDVYGNSTEQFRIATVRKTLLSLEVLHYYYS